ncbi:MAG: hypothetical protein F7C07_08510 [Desulfurococcales archaeon]|nr:hypothetical protein [Desulfurococcales archaeon]
MKREATLLVIGVLAGLLVDYASGHIPLATAVAAAIASYGAPSLKRAAVRGVLAGLAWITLAYLASNFINPGALDMISLTAKIAGLPVPALYLIAYLIVAVTAVAIASLLYYSTPKPGR